MLLLREDPRQLEPREPAALLLCALRTVTEPPSSVAGPAAETMETASLTRSRWVGLHRANSGLKSHTAHCTQPREVSGRETAFPRGKLSVAGSPSCIAPSMPRAAGAGGAQAAAPRSG